jgi:hypothetical protein
MVLNHLNQREDMEKSKNTSKNRLSAYLNKCASLALKAAIWAGVCFVLNIALLYFCQLLFGFYLKTPMGPDFSAANPELMDSIKQLSDMGFENLSIPLVLTVFFTCQGILVTAKIFYVARYITPLGIFGRLITCVLPIAAVVALLIPEFVQVDGWITAYVLSIFPTFVLFNICFEIADELFPEMDDMMAFFQKSEDSGKKINGR